MTLRHRHRSFRFTGVIFALFACVLFGSFKTSVSHAVPVVVVPADMFVEAESSGGTNVDFDVVANDPDGLASLIAVPPSGSLFPIATTPVTATAVNITGESASASFNITVADTTPPVVTAPANIIEITSDPAGKVVTYTGSAFDVVGLLSFTASPPSGSLFPLGTTLVFLQAEDLYPDISQMG